MSRIDSPTFVQLLAALMNNPEVVETLSRLGISLFDNNRQCFLTEGMWKEISDEKILKMKDSWASSPHPENREETGATQGTASQSSGNPPRGWLLFS